MKYLLAACVALCACPATASASDWRAMADQYASTYAVANQFGSDTCAGQTITVNLVPATALATDVLGQAHIGYEKDGLSSCTMAVLETMTDYEKCTVYVHERLHLWRDDVWHDPTEGSPLYYAAVPVPGSCDGAMPIAYSLAEIRAVVRKRLDPRWRLRFVMTAESEGRITEARFKAVRRARKGRKIRVYLATVSDTGISVALISKWRTR